LLLLSETKACRLLIILSKEATGLVVLRVLLLSKQATTRVCVGLTKQTAALLLLWLLLLLLAEQTTACSESARARLLSLTEQTASAGRLSERASARSLAKTSS
jgi:hypothetical protein